MKLLPIVLSVLLFQGCAVIDTSRPPPSDFPQLVPRVVHVTDNRKLQKFCKAWLGGFFVEALACADLQFEKGECVVYTRVLDNDVLIHEHYHCRGYNHKWSTGIHDTWQKYKKDKKMCF